VKLVTALLPAASGMVACTNGLASVVE
jgi:hypothetical protein